MIYWKVMQMTQPIGNSGEENLPFKTLGGKNKTKDTLWKSHKIHVSSVIGGTHCFPSVTLIYNFVAAL